MTRTPPAQVDVVIAVHTPRRPVGRAVASVLEGNEHADVIVVCHNVGREAIESVIDPGHRSLVRYLEHDDAVPSPAGPFNAGMRASQARFVSIMGSDDTLEPGAVRSWLDVAGRHDAEVVVSRLVRGPRRRTVPTPPVRPWLRGLADPVADRLSYRSAPLGLVSNEARRRLGAELVEGVVVGDDVPYVTRLWFEARVAVDRRGPAYVVGEDATDRVTFAPRPIEVELAFLLHLLGQDWFRAYPAPARHAVAVKVTRIHLFGAVYNRPDPEFWTTAERDWLARVARGILAAAPGVADVLSRADRDLLRGILDPDVPAARIIDRARARRRHGTPRTLLTRHPGDLLRREAPLRLMAASALVR